jgi:hypothetical protein
VPWQPPWPLLDATKKRAPRCQNIDGYIQL